MQCRTQGANNKQGRDHHHVSCCSCCTRQIGTTAALSRRIQLLWKKLILRPRRTLPRRQRFWRRPLGITSLRNRSRIFFHNGKCFRHLPYSIPVESMTSIQQTKGKIYIFSMHAGCSKLCASKGLANSIGTRRRMPQRSNLRTRSGAKRVNYLVRLLALRAHGIFPRDHEARYMQPVRPTVSTADLFL